MIDKSNKSIIGYRYELYRDGKYQGVGPFQGIDTLDICEESKCRLEKMFSNLKEPPYEVFSNGPTTSYFTKNGKCFFAFQMRFLENLFKNHSIFDIKLKRKIINPDDILYIDEYQIVVRGHKYF